MDFHNIYRKKWTTGRFSSNRKTIEALFVCCQRHGRNKCSCFYEFVEHDGGEKTLLQSGIELSPELPVEFGEDGIERCIGTMMIQLFSCDNHELSFDEWRNQFTEVTLQ